MAQLANLNIAVNSGAARASLGAFQRSLKATGNVAQFQLNRMRGAFASVTGAIFGLQGALATIGVGLGVSSIVNVTLQAERLRVGIGSLDKEASQTAQTMDFLRSISNRLGTDFLATSSSFKTFSIAARSQGQSVEETNRIFEAFLTASAAMKLSNDDLEGSLRAVGQMFSKGNVQAEELRGQLGERLPVAFALAAEAMGTTTQGLNKMLDNGEVLANDLLPKMATLLDRDFSEAAKKAGQSATANFNRFGNAINDVKIAIGESGLVESLVLLTKKITEFVRSGDLVNYFTGAIIGVGKFIDVIILAANNVKVFFNSAIDAFNSVNDFGGGYVAEFGLLGLVLLGRKGFAGGVLVGIVGGVLDAIVGYTLKSIADLIDILPKQIQDKLGFSSDLIRETGDARLGANPTAGVRVAMQSGVEELLELIGVTRGENAQRINGTTQGYQQVGQGSFEQMARNFASRLENNLARANASAGANISAAGAAPITKSKSDFDLFVKGVKEGFTQIQKSAKDFSAVGKTAVVSAFGAMDNAIEQFAQTGKLSFKDFARTVLIDISKIISRIYLMRALTAATSAGSGIPFLEGLDLTGGASAGGGAMMRGKGYMVGERGAEMFVPRTGGHLLSNNELGGGNITVVNNYDFSNADASVELRLRATAEQIKNDAFSSVFGAIESGGRYAKATGRR